MTSPRLFVALANAGADPATQLIEVSISPDAGALQVANADGLRTLNLLAPFWDSAIPAGESGTGVAMTGPVADGKIFVPPGWTARIYLITAKWISSAGGGVDISNVTFHVYLSATGTNITDQFDAMVSTNSAINVSEPLVAPYEIDGDGDSSEFQVLVATNGTTGTASVAVNVYGYLFRNI